MLVPTRSISVNVKEEFTSGTSTGPAPFMSGRRAFTMRDPRSYMNVMLEPADEFDQRPGGVMRPPSGPEDTSLAIENVQPGRYWVKINSSRGYASSVTSGGVDLQREPLRVGLGSISPIEVTMRDDSAQIDGTIEGANISLSGTAGAVPGGAGLASPGPYTPSAHVYCVPLSDSTGQFTEIGVSPEGTFTSPELPPGVYRVLAFKRQQTDLEYRNPEAMRAYDAKGLVVRLVAGQKEHLRLPLVLPSQ
jgi:hypothetical protein